MHSWQSSTSGGQHAASAANDGEIMITPRAAQYTQTVRNLGPKLMPG
jgi:hypothetical protein